MHSSFLTFEAVNCFLRVFSHSLLLIEIFCDNRQLNDELTAKTAILVQEAEAVLVSAFIPLLLCIIHILLGMVELN
jgi:hypothetical protein